MPPKKFCRKKMWIRDSFHWGGLYGRIVTNPPYGERLLEREEAIEEIKLRSRQYAKRQLTWLRRDKDIHLSLIHILMCIRDSI